MGRQRQRARAGQSDQAGLAGRVVHAVGRAGVHDHRGDVDDRAARAARDHRLGGLARAQERALQVDAQDPVPLGLGGLEEVGAREDAGVVDQKIDAAQGLGGLDHARDLLGHRHVALNRPRPAAGRRDPADDRLGGRRVVQVIDDHAGALAPIGQRDRLADALLRPGDDRHSVAQSHFRPPDFRFAPPLGPPSYSPSYSRARTRARSTGRSSAANQGLRLSQAVLRQLGCGRGRNPGAQSAQARTVSVSVARRRAPR